MESKDFFNPYTSYYYDNFRKDISNTIQQHMQKLSRSFSLCEQINRDQINIETERKVEQIFMKLKESVVKLPYEKSLISAATEFKNNILTKLNKL